MVVTTHPTITNHRHHLIDKQGVLGAPAQTDNFESHGALRHFGV